MSATEESLFDEEMERRSELEEARRADFLRQRAAAAPSNAAAGLNARNFSRETQQRAAYQFVMRGIGEGVLSETIIVPLVVLVIDNIRFFAANIKNGGKPVRLPFLPDPNLSLPPLNLAEIMLLLFEDLIVVPLLLLLNPFSILMIIIVTVGGGI